MSVAKRAMLAFNIQNVYHLRAVREAAHTRQAPIIAQVSAKYIPFFEELYGLARMVDKYQSEHVFFHLDHCMDETVIHQCVDAGFAGVMFDGSSLPVSENISRTNEVHAYASERGTLVEAELGAIQGVEDGFGVEEEKVYSKEDLRLFMEEASFDLLALAIGNAHGEYTTVSGVRLELLDEANEITQNFPLVLHGGTGLPEAMVQQAISSGVVKVNISTALKIETHKVVQDYIDSMSSYDELKLSEMCVKQIASFCDSLVIKYTL